jgi:ribosomal protein L32
VTESPSLALRHVVCADCGTAFALPTRPSVCPDCGAAALEAVDDDGPDALAAFLGRGCAESPDPEPRADPE